MTVNMATYTISIAVKIFFLFQVVTVIAYPFKEDYITQKLDHFNNQDLRYFKQRILIQDKWWGTSSSPVFFYTGNEGNIEQFWNNTGFVFDIAPKFNALVVFAEHRYYGKSLPFGPVDSFTSDNVGYLSINQVLADFALIITSVKRKLNIKAPVISFGGSYGGMLTAYLKLKYPGIIQGGIAASAPVLSIVNPTYRDRYFFQSVTKSFADEGCADKIRTTIKHITIKKDYAVISNKFNLCKPLTDEAGLNQFLGWIRNAFVTIAMVNYPYPASFLGNLPGFPVKKSCDIISKEFSVNPYDGLAQVVSMLYGDKQCHDIYKEYVACSDTSGCGVGNDGLAWDYQACTELLSPGGTNSKTDMFADMPFTMDDRKNYCSQRWNVTDWSTFNEIDFGMESINQTSNIIFSNGNLDPWHGGGVLYSIKDRLISLIVIGGAHHLDLRGQNPLDPPSVRQVRKMEEHYIEKWIREY
ncbi:DgyrCDS6162 [Dimorphilus gyrociliatus]|uniref:DgyrCDS6162 n=1 Tax=Dimorphilus gyrociliatus TaxID=2664684 RepID=A0A7I8VQ19_9ANNE|nr:DgyrCDS6162 [Dimorphilus gyrociliatus]